MGRCATSGQTGRKIGGFDPGTKVAQVRRFFCHLTHSSRPPAADCPQKRFWPTFNNLGFQISHRKQTENECTRSSFFVIFRETDALAPPSPPSKIASDRDRILGAHIDAVLCAQLMPRKLPHRPTTPHSLSAVLRQPAASVSCPDISSPTFRASPVEEGAQGYRPTPWLTAAKGKGGGQTVSDLRD